MGLKLGLRLKRLFKPYGYNTIFYIFVLLFYKIYNFWLEDLKILYELIHISYFLIYILTYCSITLKLFYFFKCIH